MANTNAEQLFRAKAPGIIAKLIGDFPFTPEDGCAVTGNAGHECLGFTALQEFKPVVSGSRGGWGWMQWTGPRRRAFEAYCNRNKLDPASDKANYAWLFLELKGEERKAVNLTKTAAALDDKVVAFEKSFLRAGVKHYPQRKSWARIARSAYEAAGSPIEATPKLEKVAILTDEAKAKETTAGQNAGGAAAAAGGGGAGTVAIGQGPDVGAMPIAFLIVTAMIVAGIFIFRAVRDQQTAKALRQAAAEL